MQHQLLDLNDSGTPEKYRQFLHQYLPPLEFLGFLTLRATTYAHLWRILCSLRVQEDHLQISSSGCAV